MCFLASSGNTVVKHLPQHLKFKSLCLTTAAGTGKENGKGPFKLQLFN